MGTVEENKEIARNLTEAFAQSDMSIIDELTTDDFVSHNLSTGTHSNKETLKQMNIRGHDSFSDVSHTVEKIVSEGDLVASFSLSKGTHTGKYGNITPTGKEIKIYKVGLCRIEKGKIAELWILEDTIGMLQQLEILPSTAEILTKGS